MTLAPDHRRSIRAICAATARHCGVTYELLVGPSREKALVRARHLAIYIARKRTGRSTTDIGRAVGGRDHTTICNALQKTEAALVRDADLKRDATAIGCRLAHAEHLASLTGADRDRIAESMRRLRAGAARLAAERARREALTAAVIEAAWRLVSATDQVAEAGHDTASLAAARRRQADAYRRLRSTLKAHTTYGGSHAQP